MTLFLIGLFLGVILTAFVEHCDRAKGRLEGRLELPLPGGHPFAQAVREELARREPTEEDKP